MAIGRIPEPGTGIPESIIAAKGDLIAGTANDTPGILTAGSNETRLVADSSTATGLKYVADTTNYAIAAKGDLLVGTGADTLAALTVGTNGHTLVADSSTATGLKWAAASGGDFVFIGSTSFSAASTINVNDVFSATYRNYRVMVNLTGSTGYDYTLRWRVSGSDNTTTNYAWQEFSAANTTVSASRSTGQTSTRIGQAGDGPTQIGWIVDIFNPYASVETLFKSHSIYAANGTPSIFEWQHYFNATTSFTGFTILTNVGTATGTIRVYGYKD